MLRPLLLLCLIISTLGYGSVWAFDGHFDEWTQHETMSGTTDHGEEGEDIRPVTTAAMQQRI